MSLYGMQRANGDWFAIKEPRGFRVPLFSSLSEAASVRTFNVEMLVFNPALFDERALKQVERLEDGRPVYFWLVEKASRNMRHGMAVQYTQLALILSGAEALPAIRD